MADVAHSEGAPRFRAVFVSDTGVARGAVYGLRVMAFAAVLARRGHRIVVISPALHADDDVVDLDTLPLRFSTHDWRSPLVLKRLPFTAPDVSRLPVFLRRLMTALQFAIWGGTDRGWSRAAAPLSRAVARLFRPDIVWATFGSTSNLVAAQGLARESEVPWVADLKDNVDIYVPATVRWLLARRFADMAGATSNAQLHADAARRWLSRDVALVRSGFAPEMAASETSALDREAFRVTLVGSVYGQARCDAFIAALAHWIASLPDAARHDIRFRYAGVAPDTVRTSLATYALGIETQVTGNVAHADLARLCHAAAVNCYIWLPTTFHHKALELLACRRPVIAFPGEHRETLQLASETGGLLTPCADADALAAALDAAFVRWRDRAEMPGFVAGPYSWEGQGELLETTLRVAIAGHRRQLSAPGRSARGH